MRNEYRREMDALGPRPEELERLYTMLEGGTEMKQKKRLGGRAVAAIAVCAALMVTAAAAAPTVWETLAARLGVFAPYAQTIDGAVSTDQGIEVQVLSALSDELEARVYVSVRDVEENRLSGFLTLDGTLTAGESVEKEPPAEGAVYGSFGNPSTSNFELVSYDTETKTALFSARIIYGDAAQPVHEAQLSLTGMTTRKAEIYADKISCAAVTGAELDSLPAGKDDKVILDPDSVEGTGYDNSVLPETHVVLAPGQTPMAIEGTEDMRISSMGFASDGCFHIRLEFADGVAPQTFEPVYIDSESGVNLCAGQVSSQLFCDLLAGNSFDVKSIVIRETLVEGGMDILFPLITLEDLEELQGWQTRVYGFYTRPGTDVEGNWSVEFQMDYYSSVTLDWIGELDGSQVRQVTLSPLSVTMTSDNSGSFYDLELSAVKKDGSTVAAERGTSSYTNLGAYEGEDGPYDAYNTWKFEEPVDLEDVAYLKLGDGTIPVN